MLIGDPFKFAILFEKVDVWNTDTDFSNGFLIFSVNGNMFPKVIINTTLNSELRLFCESSSDLIIDERLFSLTKEEMFAEIYQRTFPSDFEIDIDYRFDLSPASLSDNDCFIFAVSDGGNVRIIAAELKYNIEESRHELLDIDVSEAVIPVDEFKDMVLELKSQVDTQFIKLR